ncbi:MAG TPA: hypothetical protein VF767_01915 [Bryobacteraceae bacterium]
MAFLALAGMLAFYGCGKKEATEAPAEGQSGAAAQPADKTHALVHLKDGSKVAGTIVASSQTDMTVAGDDGIERKIPMAQVKSVEYGEPRPVAKSSRQTPRERTRAGTEARESAPPPAAPPAVTTTTYELPVGSEISVRTDDAIDSGTAAEGQTFGAQVTRDAKDADGAVVIPRGSSALVVIRSASKGGRFRGASDLVLDLQSVNINGRQYLIDTADVTEKGKAGVGANKRTATYTGGGAALGAIIGAIAGGGKGAAIGAGAGAGAGALTQILTKGGAIKVPAESVLTFRLDKTLKVTAAR